MVSGDAQDFVEGAVLANVEVNYELTGRLLARLVEFLNRRRHLLVVLAQSH
jgi:hypothetical protein